MIMGFFSDAVLRQDGNICMSDARLSALHVLFVHQLDRELVHDVLNQILDVPVPTPYRFRVAPAELK
jgi:hypothetical protein